MSKKEEKYWFKAKLYGWGWVPVTVQGWIAIISYLVYMVAAYIQIEKYSHSSGNTLKGLIPDFVVATGILFLVCLAKGEKLRWHWGK